jgi:hypothetical protein
LRNNLSASDNPLATAFDCNSFKLDLSSLSAFETVASIPDEP